MKKIRDKKLHAESTFLTQNPKSEVAHVPDFLSDVTCKSNLPLSGVKKRHHNVEMQKKRNIWGLDFWFIGIEPVKPIQIFLDLQNFLM